MEADEEGLEDGESMHTHAHWHADVGTCVHTCT